MAEKNRVLLALLTQATKELKDQFRAHLTLPLSFIRLTLGGVRGQFPRNLYTFKNGIWARKYGRIRVLGKCMEIRPHFVP